MLNFDLQKWFAPEEETPHDGPDGAEPVKSEQNDLPDHGHHEERRLLAVALKLDDAVALDHSYKV